MTTPAASGLELPDVREQFTEWLAREMPAGTVISDPRWWAPKIIRAFHDYRSIAQAALAAQPTPTMWNALNGNDPLPTPAQPADIALAVGEDLYKALERRAVFAKCIQGDLLAIPLLTTLALVSDANKRNPNPVAWQVRHFFAGGYWSGWAQAPSEDEAKAVVARHAKAGTQAEYRRLYDAPAQPAPGVGGDWDSQAYASMADELESWKQRALAAEADVTRMCDEFNAENVPTHMGEPVLSTRPAESVAQGGEDFRTDVARQWLDSKSESKIDGIGYGIIDPDYARIFTIARVLCWSEGYALTMHGSFTRDLDLVAVPWTDRARDPEHLARRVLEACGLKDTHSNPGEKPHGRLVWTMRLPDFGDPRFVDFSIIPPTPTQATGSGGEGESLSPGELRDM